MILHTLHQNQSLDKPRFMSNWIRNKRDDFQSGLEPAGLFSFYSVPVGIRSTQLLIQFHHGFNSIPCFNQQGTAFGVWSIRYVGYFSAWKVADKVRLMELRDNGCRERLIKFKI